MHSRPYCLQHPVGLLVCGALALSFVSCGRYYNAGYQLEPVSRPTTAPPENPDSQVAIRFFNNFIRAENLPTGAMTLKGIKEVSVAITISDNFVENTYLTDCKTELVQKLRGAGLVVKEKSDVLIILEVVGFWDAQAITATYWIEIDVYQSGHFGRNGKHYMQIATCWHTGRVGHAGRHVFSESFTSQVHSLEGQLINDWITASQ
jgi:hypothetical protein